jgi:phage N-6-adenine-methyltransferase
MSNTFWTTTAASSADETWQTPATVWTALNNEFGFTLDAAALSGSTLVPGNWYGPDHQDSTRHDALTRDWAADANGGAVFCNPPYGRTTTWAFTDHACKMADNGATVVLLIPARTDTRGFQRLLARQAAGNAEVRFVAGRLKFGAVAGDPAPFPSAIVIVRP